MNNKIIIITGASSGIGRALAFQFAKQGAKVVLAARRKDYLLEIQNEIGKENSLIVQTDVTSEADCQKLIDQTVTHFGGIDVLINNAGISMRACLADCDTDVLQRVIDVNFWGTVYCTKAALPYIERNKGSIVGVVSIAGFIGLPGRTAYSASKYAIRGFLDAVRLEYLKRNVHVLIAAPGFVASDIRKKALIGNGLQQIESPRNEAKMMTADVCAKYIYRAVKRRKRLIVLSFYHGKLAVFFSKWWPQLVDRVNYNVMCKEPDSPLNN